jgi:16S rRNA processing protein RimM
LAKELDSDKAEDQRGLVEDITEPRFLVIGEITKPHGVRGEMRVMPLTDRPERFTWLKEIFLGEDGETLVPVTSARLHQNFVLLKLAGYETRDAAESLRGTKLVIPADQAIPLEEGEYYLYELIGMDVLTEAGESLGEITDVIETGANNVFVVRGAERELLIPDIPDVVLDIDFEDGRMIVRPLPGLFTS